MFSDTASTLVETSPAWHYVLCTFWAFFIYIFVDPNENQPYFSFLTS